MTKLTDLKIVAELADDAVINILQFCSVTTLYNLCCASNTWRVSKLSNINIIWKRHYVIIKEKFKPQIFGCSEYKNNLEKKLDEILKDQEPNSDSYKRALKYFMNSLNQPQYSSSTEKIFKYARTEFKPPKINSNNDYVFEEQTYNGDHIRVVSYGDGAVGKTCLHLRACADFVPSEYIPTVFDSFMYIIKNKEDQPVMGVSMFDTAGHEEYDYRLPPIHYRQAEYCFLIFSVIQQHSFENIKNKWVEYAQRYCPLAKYILVATKCDLRQDEKILERLKERGCRVIQPKEGEKLARELRCLAYVETSSLVGYGSREMCNFLAALHKMNQTPKKEKKCIIH